MSPTPGPEPRRTTGVVLFAAAFLATWTVWAAFLTRHPLPPQAWPIRIAARLFLFLAPALLYIRLFLREQPVRYLRLTDHPVRGALFGLLAGLLPLGELAWRAIQAHALPKLPHSSDVWLNVILAAPLTEEILFRGLLFREFSRATSPIQGAIYSSLLFAALHFPYWYLSGAKSAQDLATSMPLIFAIGMLCCALTWRSRSLIAPVVLHFLNNLTSSSTF